MDKLLPSPDMSKQNGRSRGRLRLFSGRANPELAIEIAQILDVEPGQISINSLHDSETHVQIEESVRGAEIYLVQPTCRPVNETLMELLIIVDAMRRASADQITAVVPYYGYGRQDHKSTGREPLSARLVADLLANAGADRIVSVDLHAPQIQGFFNKVSDHLTAVTTLANHLRQRDLSNAVIVAPDVGRAKLAEKYTDILGLPMVLMHKRRHGVGGSRLEVEAVVGDIEGRKPIIIDDLIASGSIHQQADTLMRHGAQPAIISVTHPVLTGRAPELLTRPSIEEVLVTNTIPVPQERRAGGLIKVISIAPLLASAILRIHERRSVSEVFSQQNLLFPV